MNPGYTANCFNISGVGNASGGDTWTTGPLAPPPTGPDGGFLAIIVTSIFISWELTDAPAAGQVFSMRENSSDMGPEFSLFNADLLSGNRGNTVSYNPDSGLWFYDNEGLAVDVNVEVLLYFHISGFFGPGAPASNTVRQLTGTNPPA